MRALKLLGIILAVLMAGPVIFVLVISVQEGCLLCLEGNGAGSAIEVWLNLGLLAGLALGLALVWWVRRKESDPTNR